MNEDAPAAVPSSSFIAPRSSFFLTLEGGEGAGKSTQARLLAARLEAAGHEVVCTREPGGTGFGEAARALALDRRAPDGTPLRLDPTAELLLFAASRAQLVEAVIRPALGRGAAVICDRYTDSTVAYQGHGRGLSLDQIARVNEVATGGLAPDLTVLLDLPVEVGLARRLGERAPDQFEQESLAFHERIRAGFRSLAAVEPGRWMVVDATRPADEIAAQIWAAVAARLDQKRSTSRPVSSGWSAGGSEQAHAQTLPMSS